jgi:integrase
MSIYRRSKHSWWMEIMVDGVRYRESAGRTRQEAKEYEAKRLIEIKSRPQATRKMNFGELAKEFLEAYSAVNKKSFSNDVNSIKFLYKFFGDRNIKLIKKREAELYKSWRLKQVARGKKTTIKPSTLNRELACLKTMFSYAEEHGLLSYNPMRKLSLLKERNKRLRYLTIKEIERLLETIDLDYLRVIVVLALGTGMRRGEILQLKWKYINFEEQYIEVGVDEMATKSGKRRIVPIDDYVAAALRSWKSDSEYLFCKDGKPLQEVKKSFKRALQKAGIEDFTFHDLRHTFASHAVMNGMDLYTLQNILGHSSIKMTERYSHLSKSHLKKSAQQGSIFKKITTLLPHSGEIVNFRSA